MDNINDVLAAQNKRILTLQLLVEALVDELIETKKVKELLSNIRDEKMKGKKFKIEVARMVIKREEEDRNSRSSQSQ